MSRRVSIDREQVESVIADLDKIGEVELAAALRTALAPVEESVVDTTAVTWALNWYKTKRHVPHAGPQVDGNEVRAHCSPWTSIYPRGKSSGSHAIPPANTEAVMSVDPCKVCLKEATRRATTA